MAYLYEVKAGDIFTMEQGGRLTTFVAECDGIYRMCINAYIEYHTKRTGKGWYSYDYKRPITIIKKCKHTTGKPMPYHFKADLSNNDRAQQWLHDVQRKMYDLGCGTAAWHDSDGIPVLTFLKPTDGFREMVNTCMEIVYNIKNQPVIELPSMFITTDTQHND